DRIREISSNLRGLTFIGVSDIVANGISAIFWFYIAALLGTENYGHVSYFLSIAGIASTLSMLGAENAISVYTPKNVRLESTIFFIVTISSAISALVTYFLFHSYGISIYILGAAVFGLAASEIVARGLYSSYSRYLITQKALMITLGIGFYYVIGVDGIILGLGVSFFPYAIRIVKEFRSSVIDFSLLKSKIGFMGNSYVLNIASAFNGSIDKLIIAPMVGFALLGNYQLGIQFLAVLHIIPSIVYKYVLPQEAGGNPNKKLKQAIILISIGIAGLGIVLSPIVIPVAFPKFTEAIQIIQIMSISVIATTINLMYISKFLGNEKIKIILVSSGIYIGVLVLSIFLLGKAFGINGMATALVLATFSESIFYYFMNKFKEKD
ncbi:MAG: hypothetical protein EB149_08060, partial [Thaumarchaeota archaeon]|nr:hypothetical protein [Nitrososphaerota archaeon]